MGSWIFDLSMVVLAVAVMVFVAFKLLFSAKEASRQDAVAKPRPAFERREPERSERRRRRQQPPNGVERRFSQRR